MADANLRLQLLGPTAKAKELDPQRFALVSDKTYGPDEVEEVTQQVQQTIPDHLRRAPSAKMFLRSFWYRLTAAKQMDCSKMHVYTLAR